MDEERAQPRIEIGNEFATVEVTKVETRAGVRLRISSPRLGYSIDLDPLALESLTWQEPEFFSQLLATPLGPGIVTGVSSLSELTTPDGDDSPA